MHTDLMLVASLVFMIWVLLVSSYPTEHSTSSGIFSKGVFEHDGKNFELFHRDAYLSPAQAYQEYLHSQANVSTGLLLERGYDPHYNKGYMWLNCTAEGTFVGGCNKDPKTAPKEYYRHRGDEMTYWDLNQMLTEAFDNGRGGKHPRAICKLEHGSSMCVTWDQPEKLPLRPDQREAIAGFMISCAGPQGMLSSQVRTGFDNNVTDKSPPDFGMICLSNRAVDCTRAEWFCKDIFNKDPTESHNNLGQDTPSNWDTSGWSWPWAKGPCTWNCDDVSQNK